MKQTTLQQISTFQKIFYCFASLQLSDDSGEHSQNPGFTAGAALGIWRRLWVETTITGTFTRIEKSDPPVKLMDTSVNKRFFQCDTGVVNQIACRKIITPVED